MTAHLHVGTGIASAARKKYDIIMTLLRHYYDIIMTFL